ncbi:uncharacterized protein LOC116201014 isoform X2 [Punica granatum]|uniref:Uncharacterized protein LOC116201014 isoform X2 n=1 Tax=Punica granatum TaxID=22663 RepID=A0A6P8D2U7_PUNGR|nr:uncharacterized protein LOC116201014 isoform X2 [Punica granatum]
MGKTRALPRGPEKKPKPTKRTGRKRRRFSKTGLAKYLKADSHLYGPLVGFSPSSLIPPKTLHSSDTGVKAREPSKGKEKRLLEKISEYLKSDSHMYASVVDVGSASPAPASGSVHQAEKVIVAAFRTVMTVKEVIGRLLPGDTVPETAAPEGRGLGHREAVNHNYRNCRTSLPSGTESMSRELRRLVG